MNTSDTHNNINQLLSEINEYSHLQNKLFDNLIIPQGYHVENNKNNKNINSIQEVFSNIDINKYSDYNDNITNDTISNDTISNDYIDDDKINNLISLVNINDLNIEEIKKKLNKLEIKKQLLREKKERKEKKDEKIIKGKKTRKKNIHKLKRKTKRIL